MRTKTEKIGINRDREVAPTARYRDSEIPPTEKLNDPIDEIIQ